MGFLEDDVGGGPDEGSAPGGDDGMESMVASRIRALGGDMRES